MLNRN